MRVQLLCLTLLVMVLFSCENDDDTTEPEVMVVEEQEEEEEQQEMLVLPDATQTGANTFGCTVDGVVFADDDGDFPTLYFEDGDSFSFRTGAINPTAVVQQVGLLSNKAPLEEGMTYELSAGVAGTYAGTISFEADGDSASTTPMSGELTITRLDLDAGIVSGTFWFDVTRNNGDLVEIREGRFDQLID